MKRHRKRSSLCRGSCGTVWAKGDLYWKHGFCPACRERMARERRAQTGARAISRARELEPEVRDGQVFKVVRLPPKYR